MAHDHEVAGNAVERPTVSAVRPAGDAGRVPLAARAATPASLLRLQQLAGNGAVQRVVGADEAAPAPTPTPAPAATTTPAATPPGAGGNTLGDGAGPVSINGPTVGIHAPMVQADGVFRATTIIADSVVASNYTPGAGNVW